GPHSTADDASRYRSEDEVAGWKARDPLERYRGWLEQTGVADSSFFAEIDGQGKEFAQRMRRGVTESGPRPAAELFEWVFGDLPPHLARQKDEALRFARVEEGGDRG